MAATITAGIPRVTSSNARVGCTDLRHGHLDPDGSAKRAPEEQNGPCLLDESVQESGGGYYQVENLDQLPAVCARIGRELRTYYLLGYSPIRAARDGNTGGSK